MKFVWIYLLIITSIVANEPQERPKLPLSESLPYLQSIEHHALIMGNGPIKTYVFIDPMCPNSKNFVALIHESEKMRSKYTYYFFLYELKRFKSASLIAQIYSANNPLETMQKVMIEEKALSFPPKLSVSAKIVDISHAAEAIDVYKRPYLIMLKREK